MKKITMQKALVSGAAAFGILGFASPAAFAWSGNYSNYNSGGYGSYSSNNRCDGSGNYGNQWGNMNYDSNGYGCKPMYMESSDYQYKNNCGNYGGYQGSHNQYGTYSSSYKSYW